MSNIEGLNLADIGNRLLELKSYILSFGGGSLIAWIIAQLKMKAEIEKLKLESITKMMDINEKVSAKREIFSQNSETLSFLLNDCITSLTKRDETLAKKTRDEVVNYFYHNYFVSFINYFEIKSIALKNDSKESRYTILDEIVPFLHNCDKFKEVTNMTIFVERLGLTPLKISKESIRFLIRFSGKNTKFYNFLIRYKFKKAVDNICES
jgi:hypothetical protein